ncbi:cytochrome b-c1 complex subunit 7 [Lentinula raphanica]|uniref:Cytochrome b-c1 complex subunit 7 n=1 Tax=Lentinula raphanica TaxID=153919 RepID=A0AA38PG27_9AGAR|nr:cytochrome b-c1 complex subunit 7 [Lentinula raphanica]KAJ3760899.1 cytochrome b-c1 complex subunit 7 [Lentinula raphanica]KAJ3768147.1 cytochrome b-c1 complex subunit 7 [Lentinula raphanica]KAJ3830382.1 cytochrome b-c1 complex subunit 7 [Lentinula raphanica]KAJ3842081.1 cytochrome b-c1 complex subunit 7 [Lentinula raphanica]
MPLGSTLAPKVLASKTLTSWITPVAHWYANLAGYRKYGLKYDDLIIEEYEDVQRALNRLTPREQYDRAFRMKRASHASVLHNVLPKEQWTKPEEDVRFLTPHVQEVEKEDKERAMWDTVYVSRK